jgi:hypothetical protein
VPLWAVARSRPALLGKVNRSKQCPDAQSATRVLRHPPALGPVNETCQAQPPRRIMTRMLQVPSCLQDLDAGWMTAAISRRHPGVTVSAVAVGPVAHGTNRRATVKLSYCGQQGPPSVFVKMHASRMMHRLALVALRALGAEALLADRGVDLPLEHPAFFAGGYWPARLASIVVMEDIAIRSGVPGDGSAALGIDEVASGLRGLASLHSTFWGKPLPAELSFLRPWRLGAGWAAISGPSLARGLRKLNTATGEPPPARASVLERQFRKSSQVASYGPQTVLHGDPHPANTYSLPGRRTGFYDWQLIRTGNWSHDVGYFIAGSLETSDRRSHEKELLADYLSYLRVPNPPSFVEAWGRYRLTPAFGLATWLHTLSAGSFQPLEVCLATISRFASAYRDLGTARLS